MFKRKYVKISSEKVFEKLEDFLQRKGWHERLEPIELYALRYALDGTSININNPSIIKRIGLNDIPYVFKSSHFIIFSENDNYGVKSNDDILDICSRLDKRMIFITFFSHEGDKIEQIYVYLPSTKDTSLYIDGIYHCNVADFIRDLSAYNEDLIKYYLQNESIVQYDALKFEKEFFVFTNLNINGSTVTFHYVP